MHECATRRDYACQRSEIQAEHEVVVAKRLPEGIEPLLGRIALDEERLVGVVDLQSRQLGGGGNGDERHQRKAQPAEPDERRGELGDAGVAHRMFPLERL